MAADADKQTEGKVPLELIDAAATLELGRVLGFGAKKYAPNNWRKGLNYSALLGSIKRHTNAIERGEDTDPESGLLHAAHLLCEAMFLCHFQLAKRQDLDDRPKP